MNFQELCELTAERVNGRPLTFSSVLVSNYTAGDEQLQRETIRAVSRAHRDITLFSRHWRFLQKRGEILQLAANKSQYSLPNVDKVDWNSLYLTQSTSDARFPIYKQDYDFWQERERFSTTDDSIPVEIIRAPDPDTWIFWPGPSTAYTLNGDWQWKTSDLTVLTDEPCWDEEYHDLVSDLAVRRLEGRVRTQDEIVSNLNTKTLREEFAGKWDAFTRRYLPELRGASTLF